MTTAAGVGGERFQIFGELAEGGRDPRVFEDFGVAEKVCVAQPDKFSAPEQRRGSPQPGAFAKRLLLRLPPFARRPSMTSLDISSSASFDSSSKISRARLAAMKSSSEVIKYAALLSIAFKFFPAAGFVNINFDIEIF